MEVQIDNTKFTTSLPFILNRSDSSITVDWIHKSNHDPIDVPIHNEVEIFHARNMMMRSACNYTQYLPIKLNVMIDNFSIDFHLSNVQII